MVLGENLSFGYWVRRRRKALDLTQAELGRRTGASEAMIRKIEADERRPSRELAESLAKHLAIPPAEREAFLLAARDVAAVGAMQLPVGPLVVPPPPLPPPSNLPATMTSMVNRVRDLAAVTALLLRDDVRLLTLLGPPGMGKTRLSIQAGEQLLPHFPDGVWFVDLAPVLDPAQFPPAIALALNLPLTPTQLPITDLKRELHNKKLLLVLDNFEQIVEGAADELADLLRASKGLKVLVTSRVRLDVYGEFEYPLPPMSLPPEGQSYSLDELIGYEAVQLFVARTRQHQPAFELTPETAAPVAEICRHMDGLPLALELAAARTRRMPVGELAVALREAAGRDWLALLTTSARDLPPRQQTLFNAIAWSDNLLEPPLKAMLRQLSIFVGPFDWPAVEAVIDVPGLGNATAKREALDRLVDHNLVSRVSISPDRWRLLELVGEFARGQLEEDEGQATARRHADYFAAVLTDILRNLSGEAYLSAADAVADNGRAAYRWALQSGEATLAYRLGAAFEWYWEQRGLMNEGRRFLEQTLALPGEVDDALCFDVIHGAANQAWMQHDLATAHRHTAAGLALAYRREDLARVSGFLNLQARIYLEEGRYEEADQALVEGIRIGTEMLRGMEPSFMTIQRGEAALGLGQLDDAEALLKEGLANVDPTHVIPFCVGWTDLAEVALAKGDQVTAREALRTVAPVAHLHNRRARIFLLAVAGYLLAGSPPVEREALAATRLLACLIAANERVGDPLSVMARMFLAERVKTAKERLGQQHWQTVWDEGRHWTLEEGMAVGRGLLAPR